MKARLAVILVFFLLACGSSSNSRVKLLGEVCFAWQQCETGSFCKFPDSSCGREQESGICSTQPEICTFEHVPVCGCDGENYSSACLANSAGTSVAAPGECP